MNDDDDDDYDNDDGYNNNNNNNNNNTFPENFRHLFHYKFHFTHFAIYKYLKYFTPRILDTSRLFLNIVQ